MKTKLAALCLLALTGAAVMLYPELGNSSQRPVHPLPVNPVDAAPARVEVVFVLDTTGSMGGLIQAAKEKVWSIATTLASGQPAPEIRMGLVAYRDRGDDYVTRVTDLDTDLDSVYATLMDYEAEGGGDGPESVNAALSAALDGMSWSQDPDVYRVIFLVGDAPPHMDYADEIRYPAIVARAQTGGIIVNTIRCGTSPHTEQTWRHIAALAQGDYFSVDQAGSAVAISTPYDAELASLSAALDHTRVFFGNDEAREKASAKQAATDKLHASASEASRARRAAFNASASGAANQFGELDLLTALAEGRVELDEVDEQALPEPMKPMAPAERHAYVKEQGDRRHELQTRIAELTGRRDTYLAEEAATLDDVDASLDYRIFESVRAQAEDKGLRYDEAAPKL